MSATVQGFARRQRLTWVVKVPEHGVYGHGSTLSKARESTELGLEAAGVSAAVVLVPASPGLEELNAAREAYSEALRRVVGDLAAERATVGDIATVTGESTAVVKSFLPTGG
ncbi:hypothetical protein [Streptomyces sp. NPDC101249]|uniref:hypothetical protein n=1 Tax=Streptomyces sp. NPDC101249 TaxID=3366140 RepID=UPI0037F5AE48